MQIHCHVIHNFDCINNFFKISMIIKSKVQNVQQHVAKLKIIVKEWTLDFQQDSTLLTQSVVVGTLTDAKIVCLINFIW